MNKPAIMVLDDKPAALTHSSGRFARMSQYLIDQINGTPNIDVQRRSPLPRTTTREVAVRSLPRGYSICQGKPRPDRIGKP